MEGVGSCTGGHLCEEGKVLEQMLKPVVPTLISTGLLKSVQF